MGKAWTNAKKKDGMDSGWESDFKNFLDELKIKYEMQPKFILQPKFKKDNKIIREIIYKADFKLENELVIDIKGMSTAVFLIKKKMLYFTNKNINFIELIKAPKYIINNFNCEWLEKQSFIKIKKQLKNIKSYKEKNLVVSKMNVQPIKIREKIICLYLKEE